VAIERFLKTGTAARVAGCSTQTIYNLERRGVLAAAARTKGNQRLYKRADVLKVRDTLRARRRGQKTAE
jgi:DNA-binding transcriptional MerR regulator